MLFKSIILFAIGASAYFTIPENHPEGTYMVKRDANGATVHTLLQARADFPQDPATESAKFRFKRTTGPGLSGINEVTCDGSAFPSKAAGDAAFASLKSKCPDAGSFYDGGYSVYSFVDGGLAYWCNIDPYGRNGCYGAEVTDAISNRIAGLCGSYKSGWVRNYDRNVVIGYGARETRFCQAMVLEAKDG